MCLLLDLAADRSVPLANAGIELVRLADGDVDRRGIQPADDRPGRLPDRLDRPRRPD
jgi:hypothetical protein